MLAESVRFERRPFYATFVTDDRKKDMTDFSGERKPTLRDR